MTSRDDPDVEAADYVLTPAAQALYLTVAKNGGLQPSTWSDDATAEEKAALNQLLEIGLIVYDAEHTHGYVAVDPQYLEARWGMLLHAQAMRLLTYAAKLPAQLQELSHAYQGARYSADTLPPREYVDGKRRIRERLATLLAGCTDEVLTAQPGGPRPAEALASVVDRELGLLQRGVTMRTLYQTSARYDSVTRSYVRTISAAGAEVRTLDEHFSRMIMVDRKVAVIPVARDHNKAAFLDDPATVGYLRDVFERDWSRADPLDDRVFEAARTTSNKTQAIILRLLSDGLSQAAIAHRLGLSPRTVASHIARAREERGVDTLFQLGWKAAIETERKRARSSLDADTNS